MSLIYCPECGHEISQAAIACPSCGRPINAAPGPAVVEPVVVERMPHPREGFPLWAIVPLAIVGATLLFLLFYALGRDDDMAESNLNVNVNTRRTASTRTSGSDTETASSSETYTTTVPPTSSTTVTTAPPPAAPPSEVQSVTVPGSQTAVNPPAASKGRVVIDAKVSTRTGSTQAVRNERFYLLDKDLESILSDADLDPIEGNTLANSFGLAVMFPSRYNDFYRDAMSAIKRHIKYSGTTDGSGKAALANIEPENYYLFGITKTGGGFALWSSPVSIRPGENVLNLSPQQITQMDNSSGEEE